MDLIGEVPELWQYSGNVTNFLFDLKMFFDSNAIDDSRRRALFVTMLGLNDRERMRKECNLEKDPLDHLYACLERVYPTRSGSENAANSGEKSDAAFCPESATAAGDAGFLAGDTPALGPTARSSREKEAEVALREKARSASDAKISKNSQRAPGGVSREGSVSPTSAAPSPGAQLMPDDAPILPADFVADGGALSSRPESADSARKLQSQQANEDASESAMECYASSDNFGAESASHQGSTTYRRQPVQRPASLARSSSSTTQPKAVHKRPSSMSALSSHVPQSKRKNVGTATSRSRGRQDKKDLEVLAGIVRKVSDHDDADKFVQPVNFPGYQKVIKKPMDFGTILKNVQCSDVGTVLQDVRLVFCNCIIFNKDNSEICRSAQRLESYFFELLEERLKGYLSRYIRVWQKDKGTKSVSEIFHL